MERWPPSPTAADHVAERGGAQRRAGSFPAAVTAQLSWAQIGDSLG